MRLVADRLEAREALLQRRVVEIGDAGLDSVIEPFHPQIGLGCSLIQLGNMLTAALGALMSAIQHGCQNLLEPLRLEQTVGNVLGNEAIQLLHRDRAPLAAGLALPRLDRASVVAISPSFPGPERHGAAAIGAKADAGKKGRAAHDTCRRDLGVTGAQMRLHGIERRLIDQPRHFDGDDLAGGFQRLILGALVELVAADIGRPRQDAVNLTDAPTAAIAGEDATLVEIGSDVLDAHRPVHAIAFHGEAIDQPHRVGVQRIDLQLLLDLRAALLGRDDAVADRGQ